MLNRLSNWRALLVLLLIGCATTVSAQQSKDKALSYGFVSPNTRDDLKLEEAIKGMTSVEEQTLMRDARGLGCVVRSRIRAFPALGSWSDGAEYSLLLRINTDEASTRYVLAKLGRDARQKSVLYFYPHTGGTARIYKLRSEKIRGFTTIVNVLDRVGIAFRTLVRVGHKTIVYVVDLKNELNAKVKQAARKLRARLSFDTGHAEFVGDETAADAKLTFEKEIDSYEKRHPNLPLPCK